MFDKNNSFNSSKIAVKKVENPFKLKHDKMVQKI